MVNPRWNTDSESNSTSFNANQHFVIQEPATKNKEIWYKWLKYRIKNYMIVEAVFFIILMLVLINSYKLTSQNEKIVEMISNIEARIENLEKNRKTNGFDSGKSEGLIQPKKVIPSSVEPSSFINEPPVFRPVPPVFKPPQPTNLTFNAANFLFGASVDTSRSSSSNLSPLIGRDQSGLVLLDRPEPPSDKVWCTSATDSILTVNLAKYIRPTAVSYQHFQWNGVVPNGAPKGYHVVGCFDFYCQDITPLAVNCHYSSTDNKQEQFCEIRSNLHSVYFSKVKFNFHRNHGNTEQTCISLVRVYGEPKDMIVPKLKERNMEQAETCADLRHSYHYNPVVYNLRQKNCTVVYSYECCDECPECCSDCLIMDFNFYNVSTTTLLTLVYTLLSLIFITAFAVMCYECRRKCREPS